MSDYAACEAMAGQALDRLGPISILVNNAGIASRGNTVGEGEPAEMERVVRTHAFGSWYMAHLLIPQMREQERGDVVQITSAATSGLQANGSPYNMAKAAQEAFAHTLAKEELPNGIHVNIVAPGLVDTEMGFRLMRATRGVQSLREIDCRVGVRARLHAGGDRERGRVPLRPRRVLRQQPAHLRERRHGRLALGVVGQPDAGAGRQVPVVLLEAAQEVDLTVVVVLVRRQVAQDVGEAHARP